MFVVTNHQEIVVCCFKMKLNIYQLQNSFQFLSITLLVKLGYQNKIEHITNLVVL